jgi:phenylacetate-CoA ligase
MSTAPQSESRRTVAADDEQWLDQPALAALQRRKLASMLREVRATNPFYRDKLRGVAPDCDAVEALPFTTRAEIELNHTNAPPFGTNLTYPLSRYCRYHQTSGTGGAPLRWLDTAESWRWFQQCWQVIFDAAGVSVEKGDRVIFPFSFGPFVGFWGAFEGATARGLLAIPAGGLSTTSRLKMMIGSGATVVCCTPTYALHMAEVAAEQGIDLAASPVRALIVAGEPGGNIPATRDRIESAWGARLFDHSGMTEMGAVTFECEPVRGGLHVIESEYIAEVIDPQTLQPLPGGRAGELVLTNLGRWGSPLIRYRTNDQVRLSRGRCACGRWYARLEGGILGRIDEMFIVRGNNVFPTAVEAVVRRFPEVAEFRVTVLEGGALTQVRVEVEPRVTGANASSNAADVNAGAVDHGLPLRVRQALQETLSFRADVTQVPPGTLPRFEMKAKRFIRQKVTVPGGPPA